MKNHKTVTKEIVEAVKSKLSDPRYASLSGDDIAILCNTSRSSVSRIKNGVYDYLIEEKTEKIPEVRETKQDRLTDILVALKHTNDLLEKICKELGV